MTGLGLRLLQLSSDAGKELSRALEVQARAAAREPITKDLSVPFEEQSAGLTVHLSILSDQIAREKLLRHCKLKKYELKANHWYGLILHPTDRRITHALVLNEPWKPDPTIDEVLATLPHRPPIPLAKVGRAVKKGGRNALCPCGSGLK